MNDNQNDNKININNSNIFEKYIDFGGKMKYKYIKNKPFATIENDG